MRYFLSFGVVIAALFMVQSTLSAQVQPDKKKPVPNPVCVIRTSMGTVEVELFKDSAPLTVANFLGLAEGKKEFTDVKTRKKVKRPYFDGLIFHRVIKGFMIQGGCPKGQGNGSPGFKFKDEINAKGLGLDKIKLVEGQSFHKWAMIGIRSRADVSRKIVGPLARAMGITTNDQMKERQKEFQAYMRKASLMDLYMAQGYKYNDKLKPRKPVKGVLAMANSGPNTNGSQFFLNLGDTPHLTGKHTVFGRVVKGMDVVEKIGQVKVGEGSKPVKPIKILSIRRK